MITKGGLLFACCAFSFLAAAAVFACLLDVTAAAADAAQSGASGASGDSAKPVAPEPSLLADVFVDMEAGKDGDLLTPDILTGGTHGVGGKWRVSGDPKPLSKFYVSTAAASKLPIPVVLRDGTRCTEAGTRGWDYDHSVGAQTVGYRFATPRSNFSVGCFVSFGVPNGWNSNFDYIQIDVVTRGAYGCWANLRTTPKGNFIRTETIPAKVTTWGQDIAVEPNKTYWMTFHFYSGPRDSKFTLMIVDPKTWTKVGTSSGPMDNDVSAAGVAFGIDNNHAKPGPWHSYWDDIVIDWTNAQFPLVPARITPAPPAPAK
jgi:hypothetical protein